MAAGANPLPAFKGVWYALALFGLLTFGVGVFFIADPDETLKVFTVIFGIFLLVDGVLAMVAAVSGRAESRGLLAIVGVVSVLAGLVLIEKPFQALTVFVLIVGIWFILVGIARFVYAFTVPSGRGGHILVALVDGIAGIVILSWPGPSLSTLGVIIGIVLVFHGILFTFAAWRMVHLERAVAAEGTGALP